MSHEDMLQLFDFERVLIDQMIHLIGTRSSAKTRETGKAAPLERDEEKWKPVFGPHPALDFWNRSRS